MMICKLKDDIKYYITGKRYIHTLSVERECVNLSRIFDLQTINAEKLSTAALLHDITKGKSTEEQILLCRHYGIPTTDEDMMSPKTLHAKTGAYFALDNFPDSSDDIIFGCIRWHTTGRSEMNLLEKLLYLADYIEETRTYSDCVELRRYFYTRINTSDKITLLNKTLILSFDMTIRSLIDDGYIINSDTIKSRNYLLKGPLTK